MDETDEAIVELLEVDGRLSHRAIAQGVGLSRSAVAARVQRMISTGQVIVRGAVHPAVLGRGVQAHVSMVLSGPMAPAVAAISARDDVPFLSLTSGRFGLVAELRAPSLHDIEIGVSEFRALPGVSGVDTLNYTEVVRDVIGPVGDVSASVDRIDRALLVELQKDGRASYVDLGAAVGLTSAGARRRVIALTATGVVRVGAVVRHSGRDRQSAMGIGVRLSGADGGVAAALSGMPSVIFLARTLGRYDLLATVRTFSTKQLLEALEAVRCLPGVQAVESWTHLEIVKESYAAGMIPNP